MTSLEQAIFDLINRRRLQDGLRCLKVDPPLVLAAREHSRSMAQLGFFDHVSPVRGHETFADRARAAKADFAAVGENLAMITCNGATAEGFLQCWLDSPPHRDNLLAPAWECSGVGVHVGRGHLHATQLFSTRPGIGLDPVAFLAAGRPGLRLRARFDLEHAGEFGVFLKGGCLATVVSNRRGEVVCETSIPLEHAVRGVSFAMRHPDGAGAWSELVAGHAEGDHLRGWRWTHDRGPFPGVRLWDVDVVRGVWDSHQLWLTGTARRPGLVLVDSYLTRDVPACDRFAILLELPSGKGVRQVTVGTQLPGDRYEPVRTFQINTTLGAMVDP